jgi:hypothetical protein
MPSKNAASFFSASTSAFNRSMSMTLSMVSRHFSTSALMLGALAAIASAAMALVCVLRIGGMPP